jgi:hypothetical protein
MNVSTSSAYGGWNALARGDLRRGWIGQSLVEAARLSGVRGYAKRVLGVLYVELGASIFVGARGHNGVYTREFLLDRRKQKLHPTEVWHGSSVFWASDGRIGECRHLCLTSLGVARLTQ